MCHELASHPSKQYYPSATIPALLDVPALFNPDANSSMWMDGSLNDRDEGFEPPPYLADPKVQEGILGWLGLQRCKEEQSRLLGEIEGLLCWISGQINMIKEALNACQGLTLFRTLVQPLTLLHRPCAFFST